MFHEKCSAKVEDLISFVSSWLVVNWMFFCLIWSHLFKSKLPVALIRKRQCLRFYLAYGWHSDETFLDTIENRLSFSEKKVWLERIKSCVTWKLIISTDFKLFQSSNLCGSKWNGKHSVNFQTCSRWHLWLINLNFWRPSTKSHQEIYSAFGIHQRIDWRFSGALSKKPKLSQQVYLN